MGSYDNYDHTVLQPATACSAAAACDQLDYPNDEALIEGPTCL